MSSSPSHDDADNLSAFSAPTAYTATERANAKLLNRFYEPLHLLAVLNADRGPGEVDLPSAPQSREFRLTLRRSLDDLAWLCDHRHGGETVSAVAVQDLPEGPKFWLVSKHEASFEHLKWVLRELSAVGHSNDEEVKLATRRIAEQSITLSKDKVRRYKKALKLALAKVKENQTTSGPMRAEQFVDREYCLHEVEAITSITDLLELCQACKNFNCWRTLIEVLRWNNLQETRSPWASIWHFVGRLGCWFAKCENLVLTAQQLPRLFENAGCEFLVLPTERNIPVNKSNVNLESALKRMLPVNQQSGVPKLYEQLTDMRLFSIPDAFSENFTNDRLMGRVHAEVFLLEHFYFNEFRPWVREKYIGCSKPSCYCCSLYFRFHPGNFVLRPAHNNVYVGWIPPLMTRLDEPRERKHNLDIMNQINAYIRRDIREEIEMRMPRRGKGADSTSGIDTLLIPSAVATVI
ncbi:hypothetical protein LTR09_011369 [Extremus antarcticus]|uniref:Uncharacterized protein n=1 Tax=Extremus antarcticus TaxID=702011 RepID=A0AAJ0G4H4_9PEZI|nr:hypothetical protein LTR09_011369 [Extremus antarcticus]